MADLDVDAVAAAGDGIAFDERARVVPDMDAVAAVVEPEIGAIGDAIVASDGVLTSMEHDAE